MRTSILVRFSATIIMVLSATLTAGPAEASDTSGGALPRLLDLDLAKTIALAENPGLETVRTRLDQAAARVRQARSGYFPSVEVSTGYNRTYLPDSDVDEARREATIGPFRGLAQQLPRTFQFAGLGNGDASNIGRFILPQVGGAAFNAWQGRRAVPDRTSSYRAGVTARWLLFDGFGREQRLRAARLGEAEIEAAYRDAQRQLLNAVARSYYFAQLAREEIRIAESDMAFNERLLEEAQARRREGAGSLSDELGFEVRLNAARAALINANQDLELALITLIELIGLDPRERPEGFALAPLPEDEDLPEDPQDAGALIEAALSQRPDLEQQEHAIDRAGANVGAQRSSYYPRVSAQLSHDAVREQRSFSSDDFATSVGVDVTYEIFAGGRNRAEVAEARAAEREARWRKRESELAVRSEVQERLTELRSARENLELQQVNAELVRRNRDLVERGFEVGQEPLVRVTEAQRDLVEAEGRYAFARVSVLQAWHDLQAATGEELAPGQPGEPREDGE